MSKDERLVDPNLHSDRDTGVAVPSIYNRIKTVDCWERPQGMTEAESLAQATRAFQMGWRARRNGQSQAARPYFVDDALITDWLAGWKAAGDN